MLSQIIAYIKRDFSLEWKSKSVLASSGIYLFSTVFISLHAFQQLNPDVWNALFWVVLLFTALTIVGRSFDNESGFRFSYHYHLVKPEVIILAKLILNALYCIFLGLLAYLVFSVFLGNQIQNQLTMLFALLLGSSALGFTFTLTAAISSRVEGNLVLTSILSLPVLLPVLLIIIQLTERAFEQHTFFENGKLICGLFFLNLIVVCVSYVLFPYLWRD